MGEIIDLEKWKNEKGYPSTEKQNLQEICKEIFDIKEKIRILEQEIASKKQKLEKITP
ncbi:MAG: hypothetical protein GF335_05210, partial [Candidatus Moranbacteria bacterium]|nr:hypothetical protein [Candidatus Moranbacteria bacterium]